MKNRINKLLIKPNTLFIVWMAYVSTPLLGKVRFYIYNNFDRMHIIRLLFSALYKMLPFILLAVVSLLIYMWVKNFNLKKLKKEYLQSLWMIFVASLMSFALSQYMIYREYYAYPNYLYSSFGFTLADIKIINAVSLIATTLTASIIFINYFKMVKIKSDFSLKRTTISDIVKIITPIAAFLAVFILLEQSLLTLTRLKMYSLNSSEGYGNKFGLQYKFVDALVKQTPIDSIIITPPQGSKWPSVGNQPVLRFFLFPRKLVSGTLFINKDSFKVAPVAYFVEIDPNIVETRWPIIDTKNKNIIFNEKDKVSYNTLYEVSDVDGIKTYKITF